MDSPFVILLCRDYSTICQKHSIKLRLIHALKLLIKFLRKKTNIGLKTKNWMKLTQKMQRKIVLDAASLKMKERILVLMICKTCQELFLVSSNTVCAIVNRPLKRPPVHPGEILREDVFKYLGLSVSTASKRLGVSRQQLHRVLACTHPITTEMALRIGRFAGNGPVLWLRMQQAYDLWYAEHRMADELSRIESVPRNAESVPRSKLLTS